MKVRLTIAAQGARQPAMFGEIRMIAPSQLRPLLGLLLVSFASRLMFEIIWVRAVGLLFGATTPAITAS